MRASRRCVDAALVCVVSATSSFAQSFVDVQAAAEAGDFSRARDTATRIVDLGERARSLVWIDYGARDYASAVAEARTGLAATPSDPWLAERAVAAALALRDGRAATRGLDDFERVIARATPDTAELADWRATASDYRARARELTVLEDAADVALNRSRWTVIVLLVAASVSGWLCLRGGEQRP
ncbi:MAG: hypothetical protein K8S98_12400 [Planctomycetes bacterium]|nr:hypothetical protein [Planctomycetota bacterium]